MNHDQKQKIEKDKQAWKRFERTVDVAAINEANFAKKFNVERGTVVKLTS